MRIEKKPGYAHQLAMLNSDKRNAFCELEEAEFCLTLCKGREALPVAKFYQEQKNHALSTIAHIELLIKETVRQYA